MTVQVVMTGNRNGDAALAVALGRDRDLFLRRGQFLSLLNRHRLGPPPAAPPPEVAVNLKRVSLRERLSSGEVEWTPDFQRVKDLPRRPRPEGEQITNIVEALTQRLKRPEGTQTLRDVQALTLWEAALCDGVIGMIRTGGGKTLIGMLLPMLMPECKRALLLLPPDLRPQFASDWEEYGKHWVLPNLAGGKGGFIPGRPVLHVVAYSGLSGTNNSDLLDQINPDLVMADEMSALRNFETSRVRRFNRRFADRPHTRFCGWDASAVADSVENFWHLLAMALGMGSPVPITHGEVKKWSKVLDPDDGDTYFMPGVLTQLCESGESVRSGFQRRLVNTAGIIVTEENALGIPLIFQERRPPKIPDNVRKHLSVLRRKTEDGGWKRPDGEELRTPIEVAACAKQLAQGFYLFWRFPRQEPRAVIDLWFERRQSWNREQRAILQNPQVHMDSPRLCENAAERWFNGGCPGCTRGPLQNHEVGCLEARSHPLWPAFTYQAWREVEDTVEHYTDAKWESDWLLEDAAKWARESPGVVWVDHPEFGNRLSKMTGFRFFEGGDASAEEILTVDGSESIICSVNANKKGKNLQVFNRNLIISFPSSNATVEQAVGRTYREGQLASEVTCDYYLHTPELENSFDTAKARAKFVWQTMGQAQKMVYAVFKEAKQHQLGVGINGENQS